MMKTTPSTPHVSSVAELQGLYGLFSFPEKLFQKIWARREFAEEHLKTVDGRSVTVSHPGKWNGLGGPDFLGAQLRIGGQAVAGDVEVHLREPDWAAHRHAEDRAYDNVVLHVVLFEPSAAWSMGAGGKRIPVVALLPLLHYGLEEYAADDAVEKLANRPLDHAREKLGALDGAELGALLKRHADERWTQKMGFARERIRRLGWQAACHHAVLEILGYRFNRAPMLSVATEFPLAMWAGGRVDPDQMFETRREQWSLQGVRPLNHPRLRLRQYADWMTARPDWPERLTNLAGALKLAAEKACVAETTSNAAGEGTPTRAVRKAVQLKTLRERLLDGLCGGTVGGSRFENLVCDGFLPLVAAEADTELSPLWQHWFAGDAPADRVRMLRDLGVFGGVIRPTAHGPIQGLLGWMLAQEGQVAPKSLSG